MKKFNYLLGLAIYFLLVPPVNAGVPVIPGVPAGRLIDWSDAGVVYNGKKGIPVVTDSSKVCGATVSPGTDPNRNDSPAIQSALSSCAASASSTNERVVKLSAGSFLCSGGNFDASNVILRGAGPGKTFLIIKQDMLTIGPASSSYLGSSQPLSEPGVQGQKYIRVASVPSWIKTGNIYVVNQLDDPNLVTAVSPQPPGANMPYPGRGQGQMVMISSTSAAPGGGFYINLDQPLYYPYNNSAAIFGSAYDPTNNSPVKNEGIEDLTIQGGYTGSYTNVPMLRLQNCANCWVKNVESYNVPAGVHLLSYFSYRLEIRNSYFHHMVLDGPGNGYGVAFFDFTSASLVENNIFNHLHGPMLNEFGSAGNVFAYNFERDGWGHGSNGSVGATPCMSGHGDAASFILWEGNQCKDKYGSDFTHGSGIYAGMVYRNVIEASNPTYQPIPIAIETYSRANTIIGNVLGSPGIQNGGYQLVAEYSGGGYSIYQFGCMNGDCNRAGLIGDIGSAAAANLNFDTLAQMAPVRGGNYDYVTNSMVWRQSTNSGAPGYNDTSYLTSQALPASLYLSGAPAFFTTKFRTVSFPPIGPIAAADTTAHVEDIPAKNCYDHTAGASPAVQFDANTCWSSQSVSAPGAPRNFRLN